MTMDRLDEINAMLERYGSVGSNDIAWLLSEVRRLRDIDDKCGKENCFGRKLEGHTRWVREDALIETRALAMSMAESLEASTPVFANALQVATDMMRSGEPWSDAMAEKMRDVVSAWCDQANAALSHPILLKLRVSHSRGQK